MSLILRQSTSKVVSFGPFVDKTDGVTPEVGLVSALDHASTGILLSKNGGALTIRHATVTATTYDAYGNYRVTLDTTDTDTIGTLRMQFIETATCLPVWLDFDVVDELVYDTLFGTVALATTTNITAGTVTTATNLTNLPAITANWLTAAGIAAAALNGKGDWNIGKTGYALSSAGVQAVWDALTSALTTAGSIGKLLVDNINATLSSIKAKTDSLTFTVAGLVDANVLRLNGDDAAAANVAKTTRAIGRGTVTAGASTTSIPTSAFTPNGAAADQFKGRIITFDATTATAALQGQSTDITASSNAAAPTFTVTALTTAPASGDVFSVT